MNFKSFPSFFKELTEAAGSIKKPLTLVCVVVFLSFVLCFYLVKEVGPSHAPWMIGLLFLGSIGLSVVVVMTSLKKSLGSPVGSITTNAVADDLGHKIYMSVRMYFSNFQSADERLEAYQTLVASVTVSSDEDSAEFRDRIAQRIRENVKLYDKMEL